MKLLWVKTDFLHPTDRGGQIRTLETLKQLHRRHEIHFVALHNGDSEALERSSEYCTRAYPIPNHVPHRGSLGFAALLARGLLTRAPIVIDRYRSPAMLRKVEELCRLEKFDRVVCDFLAAAPNIPDPSSCVLFQHNVEAMIWKRHVEHARTPAHRFYFDLQARRMLEYEGRICRSVRNVIAVSEADAEVMKREYGVERIAAVPTGVDIDYFAPNGASNKSSDIVFVGAMDWMPNMDGAQWFVREILPIIRKRKPECTVTFAGRKPAASILELARADSRIQVTGTVPDIRPYVWGASMSIVPLRVGGGTRLKIFESMAARAPVVSTRVGAEGLPVEDGTNAFLADDAQTFAERCLELLDSPATAQRLADNAWEMVASRFSWQAVSCEFERLLC